MDQGQYRDGSRNREAVTDTPPISWNDDQNSQLTDQPG